MAKNNSVAETVRTLAEPIAEELGVWIWDVEFVKEGARRVLRITIDSEEGVGIDDCEKLHRAIDPLLDEADPIEEQYYLEVCSPGLERELKISAAPSVLPNVLMDWCSMCLLIRSGWRIAQTGPRPPAVGRPAG